MSRSPHAFFLLEPGPVVPTRPALGPDYQLEVWEPGLMRVMPGGVRGKVFIVWWVMHLLRLFKNRDYHQVVIRRDGCVVHRSGIYPGFVRFPFMSGDDLQIGDTWTSPAERGRGLALAAIAEAVRVLGNGKRRFWYVCETRNEPSMRVIEKAGFMRVGTGSKHPRLGLPVLGSYVIEHPV